MKEQAIEESPDLEKESQIGKIALSQNTSLGGVIQLDGLVQSPAPAVWPAAERELAARLNESPKYVVFSTLTDAP